MTVHSELGASICDRWWNCPGSVALVRGMPNSESEAARRGTAGHKLGETCLDTGQDAVEYIDRKVEGIVIDEALADIVQEYLDECRRIMALPGLLWWKAEVGFTLDRLAPPAPMFGTADFVALVVMPYEGGTPQIVASGETIVGRIVLIVRDLKSGWVYVSPDGRQTRYYALGAACNAAEPVQHIDVGIVQRGVKTREFDAMELAEWSGDLIAAAKRTQAPDAPLVAGPWCNYCPAAGRCPAQRTAALAVAQVEFTTPPRAVVLPEIRLMTPAQISEALHLAPLLSGWLKAVEAAAITDIERGNPVPGWKLVPTQGRTAWLGESSATESALAFDHGLTPADIFEAPKVRSPAQIRDHIATVTRGDHKTKKAATDAARAALASLTYTPSSGTALVPDADPRAAIPAAAAEFATLPAPVTKV